MRLAHFIYLLAVVVGCAASGARHATQQTSGARSDGASGDVDATEGSTVSDDDLAQATAYSVKQFKEARGLSGPIVLDATYVDGFPCPPCEKGYLCQSCAAVTILADSPDDAKETQLWLYGYYPALKRRTPYRFVLDLTPGYEADFLLHTNNVQEKQPNVRIRKFQPR